MRNKCQYDDKKSKLNNRDIGCALVAVLIVTVLLCICLWKPNGKMQYDIVILGDSVMANSLDYMGKSIHGHLQEQLGKRVFNGAFGGSRMANTDYESLSFCISEWSMANLANSICERDWSSAKAAMSFAYYYRRNNKQVFENYDKKMDTLSRIDFSEVEVLIIEHGTNDYNAGVMIDNENNLYDTNTFAGALRKSLKMLKETYPNLRIILVTSSYCEIIGDEIYSSDDKDWGGGLLYQYVEKEIEIANQLGVEVIDMYHNSGINKDTVGMYTVDGLHLTEAGIVLWGDSIADYLKGHVYEN